MRARRPVFSEFYRAQSVAAEYDRVRSQTLKQRALRSIEREFFASAIAGAGNVLELGAGTGEITGAIANGRLLTAIDISPAMLVHARTKYPTVHFVELDMFQIHCLTETFDAIVASRVFLHLPPKRLANMLLLCAAQLTSGGLVVFDVERPSAWRRALSLVEREKVPNHSYSRSLIHEICEKSGFGVEQLLAFDHWLPLGPAAFIRGGASLERCFRSADRALARIPLTAGRWGVVCRRR